MARTAKRYKKNTEKKVLGIPVCMAAIYARLSVDSDEKKSESIETQVTLIKEFIQKHNENPDREYLEDEDVLEMLNADMSFFQAAAELKVPPELLDFKFRMMKRSGVQIVDSPITSNSDFLKDIPAVPFDANARKSGSSSIVGYSYKIACSFCFS